MTNLESINTQPEISQIHRRIPASTGVSHYHHPLTQVIYIKKGVLAVISEAGRYFVSTHQAIVIPADLAFELIAKTQVDLAVLYFEQKQAEYLPHCTTVISCSQFLQTLLAQAELIPKEYHWRSKDGRLFRLIGDHFACAPSIDTYLPYPKDERLTNITDKLLKHPALKSDLVSWGKFVNVSSRTLTRRFKQETGITYSEWRQRLNIQIAIKHLAQQDSISSIAQLLGYESSSAFIYMFKKQMGISPKQYLKS